MITFFVSTEVPENRLSFSFWGDKILSFAKGSDSKFFMFVKFIMMKSFGGN